MTTRVDGFLNGNTPGVSIVEAKGGELDGTPLVHMEMEGLRLVFDVASATALANGLQIAIGGIREDYPHLFS